MPFNPQTGQWESDTAQPPLPAPPPYNADPQDAIERVRLASDLRAQGLDTQSIQPNIRPDKGINIRGRNLVNGSTMEALRPYLKMLYGQVANEPLGSQPHQRALGIAARVGVGGYIDAQENREKANAESVKSAEDLQKERRTYIGGRASELAKHRWELDKERRAAELNPPGGDKAMSATAVDITDRPDLQKLVVARGAGVPSPNAQGRIIVPATWVGPKPAEIALSPEAMAAWGKFTAQTGALPQGLGMGGAKTKTGLLEAGASYLKEGQDLATNKMTYRADAASFGKLQQLKDGASAFRRTAEGNFSMMLDTAEKLQDTGSPLLNRPLREWAANARGDADVAAYRAARLVIIPEFARLLTSATMAGQLTDEARKELDSIVRGEYTLSQMSAVGKVLFSDGERREREYQTQLDEIRNRGRGPKTDFPPATLPPDTSLARPKGAGMFGRISGTVRNIRGR